jgi:hypothetical protein
LNPVLNFNIGHSYNAEQHHHPFRLSGPELNSPSHYDLHEDYDHANYSISNGIIQDLSLPIPHINEFGYQFEHSGHYQPHSLPPHQLRPDLDSNYGSSGLYFPIDMDPLQSHTTATNESRTRKLSQNSYQDEGELETESIQWEQESPSPKRKKARESSASIGNEDPLDSKRKRFLERNRLAGILY